MQKKLLTATVDSRNIKFSLKKTVNPNTGKSSSIETEFSSQNWNARTLRHLKDIHVLGETRFNDIFNMASNSKLGRGRNRGAANPEPISDDELQSDDTLQSEDNNEGDEETAHVEDSIVQITEDSESPIQIC